MNTFKIIRKSAWLLVFSLLSTFIWYRPLFPKKAFFLYIIVYFFLYLFLWEGTRYFVNRMEKTFPRSKVLLKHLAGSVLLSLAYSYLVIFFTYYVELRYIYNLPHAVPYFSAFIGAISMTLPMVAIHEGLYFFRQWKAGLVKNEKLEQLHLQAKLNNEQLRRANLNARYDMLRTQVNPHFFFNSLNTLSSFINKGESNEALKLIGNLSEFFRYSLETRENEVALLADELKLMEKYAQLQKSRFGNKLDVHIDVDKKSREHFYILPFALQMLIENAIKHNEISKKCTLKIEVNASKKTKSIRVLNNINEKEVGPTTRIGLNNLKERYAYLSDKEVEISNDGHIFMVKLPLLNLETQEK